MKIEYSIALAEAAADCAELVTFKRPDGIMQQYDGARPTWFMVSMRVATMEQAQELAARFPKSAGMKARSLSGDPAHLAILTVDIRLSPDGCNKGVNETGLRRIRTICRACERMGFELAMVRPWANSAVKTVHEYGWS